MRPEANVQRRGDRSAPDFSWLFASSAMYLASLREMTREKRNHIRHHQPQKPTVRESGVAPFRFNRIYTALTQLCRSFVTPGKSVAAALGSLAPLLAGVVSPLEALDPTSAACR